MTREWPQPVSVSTSSSCCSVPHGQAMYSERLGPLELLSQPEGRVALAGTLLALLQSVGLVLSLYMMVTNYLETDTIGDPATHLCTEATFCLLFRYGPLYNQVGDTHMALAGQMLYSLLAVSVNLCLVCGSLSRRPLAFLPWLITYGLAIPGSFVLALIIPLTVVFRERDLGDSDLSTLVWFIVPLLICVAYSILWSVVFQVFSKFRKVQARVHSIQS